MSEYVDRTKGAWGDCEQVEPGPISPARVHLFQNLRTFPIDQLLQTGKELVQSLAAMVSHPLHGSSVWTPSDQCGGRQACQLVKAIRGGATFLP